jgi:hypothetical protein
MIAVTGLCDEKIGVVAWNFGALFSDAATSQLERGLGVKASGRGRPLHTPDKQTFTPPAETPK